MLPAVYVRADLVEDRQVRLAAACLWSRRAVLWGDSAWQAAFGDDTAFSTDSVIRLAHPLYREPRVGISLRRIGSTVAGAFHGRISRVISTPPRVSS